MRHLAVMSVVLLPFAEGCGPILGPSCLSRQHSGPVTTLTGTVAAAAVVVHEVPYGTEGSQNNLAITWAGQRTLDGPRMRVYATKAECVDFTPPPDRGENPATGPCKNYGSWGGALAPDARSCVGAGTCQPVATDLVQTSLTVTNGRGNPDVLGPGARYKLWVVGDPQQAATYTISISWFFGPDC